MTIKLFMEEYFELTKNSKCHIASRLKSNTNHRCWKSSVIMVLENRYDYIYLDELLAIEYKKGHGTRAIKFITGLADKHKVLLKATISSYLINDMSDKELMDFYLTNGFRKEGSKDVWYP